MHEGGEIFGYTASDRYLYESFTVKESLEHVLTSLPMIERSTRGYESSDITPEPEGRIAKLVPMNPRSRFRSLSTTHSSALRADGRIRTSLHLRTLPPAVQLTNLTLPPAVAEFMNSIKELCLSISFKDLCTCFLVRYGV